MIMSQVINLTQTEIARQGEALYDRIFRTQVETQDNMGKVIVMDLTTEDYEIDRDLILAHQRLRDRHPQAIAWTERIGYDAVYAVGGALVRTMPE
jgi:hypothetical protein